MTRVTKGWIIQYVIKATLPRFSFASKVCIWPRGGRFCLTGAKDMCRCSRAESTDYVTTRALPLLESAVPRRAPERSADVSGRQVVVHL